MRSTIVYNTKKEYHNNLLKGDIRCGEFIIYNIRKKRKEKLHKSY